LQEEMKGTIDGELATVISSISLACKQIASLVSRSGISNLTGAAGAQNVQVTARNIPVVEQRLSILFLAG
jgi:fructose-1,6-bisphosphatase I